MNAKCQCRIIKTYSSVDSDGGTGVRCIYWTPSGKTLWIRACYLLVSAKRVRTSDGGNGNHSVSLPTILIKN